MRILYDSKSPEHKEPFGTLAENQTCKITINIPKHCKTKQVSLQLLREDGGDYATFSMSKCEDRDEYEVYRAVFSLAETGLYFYRFFVITEEGSFHLYKQDYDMTNIGTGELWQLSCIPSTLKVPEFYAGKVMYQIFPDRFCRGEGWDYERDRAAEGKLEPYWVHENVGDLPEHRPDDDGIVQNNDFFGGTLRGIEEKLPYLSELGVSVIYLNPIFKAYSNHRYDTADYMKIDELLGSEDDFKSLCSEAHRLSMKIILDGVFSHTGSNSVYFDAQNIFGNGAVSNENSPYRRWFDFKTYPDDYTAWWGIRTLPCVKEDEPTYRDFICGEGDSMVRHWIRAGADGFRLDVADELPDNFIYRVRCAVKDEREDALLIGEVWEDASNKSSYGIRRKYFTGGELDSVMNYPLRNAVIAFVTGADDGKGLKAAVMTLAENYPNQVLLCLMNMLSTHDTARIINVLHGKMPESRDERAVHTIPDDEAGEAVKKLLCAYFIIYVLPGMPCIYYGDEIGTEGFEDPFCRKFFRWDLVESEDEETKSSLPWERARTISGLLKELGELRSGEEALRLGDVRILEHNEAKTVEILRTYGDKTLRCVVNCGVEAYEMRCEAEREIFARGIEKTQEQCYNIMPMGFAVFERSCV